MNIKQKMLNINEQIGSLEKSIKEIIVNPEISFEEKWETFCKFCLTYNRGNVEYIDGNKDFNQYVFDKCYSHGYLVNIDSELDSFLEDDVWIDNDEVDSYQLSKDEKEVIIRKIKEDCLNNFTYSYNIQIF